jgi:Raf kinase inhibitor-like YbhB/YbcL family protein
MAFTLTSSNFEDGASIPVRFTCDGANRAPALAWSDVPAGTRSFALVVEDPDAPSGTFTHWVVYDLPADTRELMESAPDQSPGVAGRNSFRRTGYGGPCPPPLDKPHHYRFLLHALDLDSLGLPAGSERDALESRMSGHILGTAQLVGTYRRHAGEAARAAN